MYEIEVNNTVGVITGGSSGNGLAILKAFLGAGAAICNWDIQKDENIVALENLYPDKLVTLLTDVSNEEQVKNSVIKTVEIFGKVDILINNAGIISKSKVEDSDVETYEKLFNVNVLGTVLPTKHLIPYLKESGRGRIINLSSIQAVIGMETYSPYTFTKAAVSGLTRVWALELAPYAITVNALCPGWVDTPMKNGLIQRISTLHDLTEKEAEEKILAYVPQLRFIRPEEVAFTALFLASPLAQAISGADIFLDTGMTHTSKPGLHVADVQ